MFISLPEKLKFGRLRPFMNFAAVCESAVMIIGKAIDGSQFTKAVVAPLPSRPNCCVWTPLYEGVRISRGEHPSLMQIAYLCPRGLVRVIYDVASAMFTMLCADELPRLMIAELRVF